MTTNHPGFPTDSHGWAELLPPRQGIKPLSGVHRMPWVVIGAGFTGLAAARRLAELHPDQEILLLEARLVGQAASGRNSGFAVSTSQFPGAVDPDRLEIYRRINRINQTGLDLLQTLISQNNIGCDWSRQGIYHTAADQMALREYDYFLRYLDRLEISHTRLDRDELRRRLGTDYYRKAVHVSDGALLQPAALVRGLADSLPANVQLQEQTPVLKINTGKRPRLQLTEGEVTTDRLILATNYEAVSLGYLRRHLIGSTLSGSFTRVLNTEELASLGSESEWGVLSLHGGGATLRLTRDHRISIRNTAEFQASRLLTDMQLTERQTIHRAGLVNRFPQLAGLEFEFAWSGVEGISRNGTNFFGRQADNIFLAGGYNGSGVSRGTAFGSAIAEYASGEFSQTVSDCLASAPAQWIPPRPFLDIAAYFKIHSRFKGVGLDR